MFLTEAELEYMTERKQPAAQIRWLQKSGIRHFVGALGNPRVTWAAVNGADKPPRATPNFAAFG